MFQISNLVFFPPSKKKTKPPTPPSFHRRLSKKTQRQLGDCFPHLGSIPSKGGCDSFFGEVLQPRSRPMDVIQPGVENEWLLQGLP